MKSLLFFLFLAMGMAARTQVSINTDGSLPDNSAMLDVKSATRGMLIPRMSAAQRDAIVSPATGLLIFCTDNNFLLFEQRDTCSSELGHCEQQVVIQWIQHLLQWGKCRHRYFHSFCNIRH